MRRAKIVCTLGPSTSTPERIGELIEAGMNVARLNASHGNHEEHAARLKIVRDEAAKRNRSVAVLLDLQGPKIRVGRFTNGSVILTKGDEFTITTDTSVAGDQHRVSTTYAGLPNDVQVGDQILLDDGYLSLAVTEIHDRDVKTIVVTGGELKNNKGINLPHVKVSAPSLSEKDRSDLAFGLRMGVDYIALSFVRTPDCVREAKRLATIDDVRTPVISKIEKPQALDVLEEIIEESDGIMVARGDLGVELGPEKVPLVQKDIIDKSNRKGKIVITATQMLESMISNPRPTRAEASDVANAILDGTDAVMLSGETAAGQHPVEAVRTMARIITEVERSEYYKRRLNPPNIELPVPTHAIAHAATLAAKAMGIQTIVAMTNSGGSARLMSEYRPEAKIVAMTTHETTYRRMALDWGVTPILIRSTVTLVESLEEIESQLKAYHLADTGDDVVITLGMPVGSGAMTNMLKVHRLL